MQNEKIGLGAGVVVGVGGRVGVSCPPICTPFFFLRSCITIFVERMCDFPKTKKIEKVAGFFWDYNSRTTVVGLLQ